MYAFGIGELCRELVVEVGAVGDQDDGGAGQIDAFHQQTGEEEHRVALAAAGRAEVGAAFAVAVRAHVGQDVLVQFGGGVILRVAAQDFLLAAGCVGQVDEVADHVEQARGVKPAH